MLRSKNMKITPLQCFRTPCANGTRAFTAIIQVFEERTKTGKLIAPTLPYFKHWPLLSLMTEPSMTPSIFAERTKWEAMFHAQVGYSTRRLLAHINTLQDGKYTNRLNHVSLITETLHYVNTLWKESLLHIVRKNLMDFLLEPNKCQ